jgi:nucleoside-diphosphate-sugar epimerase
MKILITGISGFGGTAIAEAHLERREGLTISVRTLRGVVP